MGDQEQYVISFENTGRLFVSTLAYPLENAKTLIQIGHEPIAPYSSTSLFGTPVLCLPNVFKYVKHIYKVDGLQGCYRGFYPWLSTNLLFKFTVAKMKDNFPKIPNEDRDEDELSDDERLTLFSGVLLRGVVCRTVAVVVTQPIHVVTVRTIAQFVGKETKYTGVFSGLWTVLKEEGIIGWFSGLLPRLLGEIFVFTVATTGVYLVHQYIVRDAETRKYVDAIVQYAASSAFYSFTVVDSCMTVTNSGIAAGSLPNMPHYHHMFDCWSHLQSINQLKRGSSILWRYYTPVSTQLLYKR